MTRRPVATVSRPTAGGERLGPAVASFLAERDLAPSSHRVYVLALDRLLDRLGADTPLAPGEPTDTGRVHDRDLPQPGPASDNRVVATLTSLFAYTTRQGLDPDLAGYRPATPPPPVRPGRACPRARAVPAAELLAFLDADHPLRDKTPWWLAVRDRRPAPGRGPRPQHRRSGTWRAVVVGRGGRAEVIGWETKTARCCPDTCTAWPAWRSAPSPPSTR